MAIRPIPQQHYLHQDGGLYVVLHVAKNADDLSESVVYQHLWPFEEQVWHRPLQEWAPRFVPITEWRAKEIAAQDREKGAQAVKATKANRRRAAAVRAGLSES